MGNRKENAEIPELVERKLQEAYQQIGAGGKRTVVWRKKLVVATVFAMLFTSEIGRAHV